MKAILHAVSGSIYLSALLFFSFTDAMAQTQTCATTITNGQNIAVNSDFSAGNTGFTYTTGASGYTYFTCGSTLPSSSCYSGPGNIYVGAHSDWFNQGFNVGTAGFGNTITDHSPTADNNFLMVDGTCTSGNDAWAQNIAVQPNTWYYFEAWVTNINVNPGSNGNASLNLNINNTPVLTFSPPAATQGNWVKYSYAWNSGTNTTADLAIQNTTNTGCGTGVDFGLDDITFTPGCAFADNTTPQPLLGADGTLCGKGGAGITLNSGLTAAAGRVFTWIQGNPGTVIAGQTGPTYLATAPGTYGVCVRDGAGCMKSDVITISASYSVSLPTPITLCNPPSATLNPGFSGPGVTYQWQTSPNGSTGWTNIAGALGTAGTYTANTPGFYRVITNDPTPGCGTKTTNAAQVLSQQTATPINAYYCSPGKANLAITGAPGSSYQWYQTDGTTPIAGATTTTYQTPTLTTAPGTSTTYYVKDITDYHTTVGATALTGTTTQTTLDQYGMGFNAKQPFTIDSVTVYWWLNNNNPGDQIRIQFKLTDNPAGATAATTITTGTTFTTTNAGAQTLGIIKPTFPTAGTTVYAVRVPVNIAVPAAGSYRLSVTNVTTSNVQIQTSTMSYPYADATGGNVVSIIGTAQGNNPIGTAYYGDMYNWKLTYKLNCGLIPVIATNDCTQPVEFVNFHAQASDNLVLLTWSTAFEKNSSYFSIQKSRDGIHFESIGRLEAAGNSSSLKNYSFVDHSISTDITYYRILEYDFDGATTESSVRTVHAEPHHSVKIVPNPNNGTFTVLIEGAAEDNIRLNLCNSVGSSVYSSTQTTPSAVQTITTEGLASGIYYLTIQTSTQSYTEKIIIQ